MSDNEGSKTKRFFSVRTAFAAFRLLVRVCFVLVAIPILLVVYILSSESGTRFALTEGLVVYNGMIPGRISLAQVSGTLLEGFTLEGVALDDADGDPLIKVARLKLAYSPLLFLNGLIQVDGLTIEKAEVHIRFKPRGNTFIDLGPTFAAGPKPEPEKPVDNVHSGPSLPFRMMVNSLDVREADVFLYKGDERRPLVTKASVRLSGIWEKTYAFASLARVQAEVPPAMLSVGGLSLVAEWDDPEVRLRDLAAETNYGALTIRSGRYHVKTLSGALDLNAEADTEVVKKFTGLDLSERPRVGLVCSGTLEALAVSLNLDAAKAHLAVNGTGGFFPVLKADLEFAFQGVHPKSFRSPVNGRLDGRGRIKVEGSDLETLKAEVDLACPACAMERVGPFSLKVKGSLIRRDVRGEVELRAAGVSLKAHGAALSFSDLDVNFRVAVPDLGRPARLIALSGIGGSLKLAGQCKGKFESPACRGKVETAAFSFNEIRVGRAKLEFSGRPAAKPLSFVSRLEARDIILPGLTLSAVNLDARGNPTNLHLSLNVVKDDDNRGALDLDLRPGPPLKANLAGGAGRLAGLSLRLLQPAVVEVRNGAVRVQGFALGVEEGRIAAEGLLQRQGESELTVNVAGVDLTWLKSVLPAPQLTGAVDPDASLKGNLASPRLELNAAGKGLVVDGHEVGELSVAAAYTEGRAKADLTVSQKEEEYVSLSVDVPLDLDLQAVKFVWRREERHAVNWEIGPLQAERLRAFAALPPDLDFSVTSRGAAQGDIHTFSAEASLGGKVSFREVRDIPFTMNVNATQAEQSVVLEADPKGRYPVHLAGSTNIDVQLLAQGGLDPWSIPFTAELEAKPINLAQLAFLLPDSLYDLQGELSASMRASGTPGSPRVEGTMQVQQGALTVVPMYQKLTDITLSVKAEGDKIKLETLSFKNGKGSALLSGSVAPTLPDAFGGDFDVRFKNYPLEIPGLPPGRLNLKSVVALARKDGVTDVAIVLSGADLKILSLKYETPKEVPKNEGVVFTDVTPQEELKREEEGNQKKGGRLRLKLTIADPVLISGQQVDMAWVGNLGVAIDGGATEVTGGLELKEGRFDFLGNFFTIERATLNFPPTGELVPFLNLAAYTDTPEARVNIGLNGPATKPELVLSSEPSMPQSQVFTLLVTGSVDSSEESSAQVQAKAANLGSGAFAMQFPELQRQLSDRVGIDRVGLTFGDTTEEPIVTAGKRVARRLYVRTSYHHNAPPDVNRAEVGTDLTITPSWNLETFYGDADVGGTDLFWHISFGNRPPREKSEKDQEKKDGPADARP